MTQISETLQETEPISQPPRGRRSGAAVVSALVVVGGLLAVGILPRLQRRAEVDAAGEAAEAGVGINVAQPLAYEGTSGPDVPGSIQEEQRAGKDGRAGGYVRT